ncbi:hypothetical protein [Propioniciclava tarda]|uniref:hypothetical protein n=1 Tax=Propioniciclava tarda TaxID=433330 RepID=UPI0011750B17|nr:hypothetical protein [Propioniciclava tarda]SMO65580.1 hypothetical protein SAMN06266982_11085 [Propioniciclava tarda]HOA87773.1 hypothetical protein [Propioniciclava tarda]HQA29830.1 hypothetical protein [Propioniciclava tarda]HQD59753.1 hypothetical protein [Propioniciclava tarda]
MSFHWEAADYRSQDFPTRAEAEAWLTECYLDLVDDGVEAVTLYDETHVVYGPMSLLT